VNSSKTGLDSQVPSGTAVAPSRSERRIEMATCARCFGTLDEGHRCNSTTLLRRASRQIGPPAAGLAVAIGTTYLQPIATIPFVLVVMALGTVVTRAVMKELFLI
jgi:hypothetical protein